MTEAWHNTVTFGATITWALMLWELRRARKVNGALARWMIDAMNEIDKADALTRDIAEGIRVRGRLLAADPGVPFAVSAEHDLIADALESGFLAGEASS